MCSGVRLDIFGSVSLQSAMRVCIAARIGECSRSACITARRAVTSCKAFDSVIKRPSRSLVGIVTHSPFQESCKSAAMILILILRRVTDQYLVDRNVPPSACHKLFFVLEAADTGEFPTVL